MKFTKKWGHRGPQAPLIPQGRPPIGHCTPLPTGIEDYLTAEIAEDAGRKGIGNREEEKDLGRRGSPNHESRTTKHEPRLAR